MLLFVCFHFFCNDKERLAFVLGRFGGLRVPTELLGYDERTLYSIFGNSSLVRKLHYIQIERRKAYAKVLEDNERLYSEVPVTKSGQQDFLLLLQEVRLLRKLLLERGILDSSSIAEK